MKFFLQNLKLFNRHYIYHNMGQAAWMTCKAVGSSKAGRSHDYSDAIKEFDGLFTAFISILSSHQNLTRNLCNLFDPRQYKRKSQPVIMFALLIHLLPCNYQSICVIVRSTLTHCAGVHTVYGECVEGSCIESVRCVCVWVNTKCAVCKNWPCENTK